MGTPIAPTLARVADALELHVQRLRTGSGHAGVDHRDDTGAWLVRTTGPGASARGDRLDTVVARDLGEHSAKLFRLSRDQGDELPAGLADALAGTARTLRTARTAAQKVLGAHQNPALRRDVPSLRASGADALEQAIHGLRALTRELRPATPPTRSAHVPGRHTAGTRATPSGPYPTPTFDAPWAVTPDYPSSPPPTTGSRARKRLTVMAPVVAVGTAAVVARAVTEPDR